MGKSGQLYLDFDTYLRQGEPSQREKASIWQTAIGLQKVDGLETSEYLQQTACKHIEGEIDMIAHIAKFVSGLWQIHAFGEGNTRTTAVFTILYLRSIGFNVDYEPFACHSWYFRNALVRANYKNAIKGIDYTPVYIEHFFRNLLLGENWDLCNRYLHIHATDEWKVQPQLDKPTSTPQVRHKYPTSTPQVEESLHASNPYILELVKIIGENKMSVKEMLDVIGLNERKNFLNLYLNPAIDEGFVRMLYPDSPRHPRQKYLLTVKGVGLFNQFNKEEIK